MSIIPETDGEDYSLDINKIPVAVLREHYQCQYHCLVGIIRDHGGTVRIPYNALVDNPPKMFRIYQQEEYLTGDIILTIQEVSTDEAR